MKEATEFLILARMRNSVASGCENRFFYTFISSYFIPNTSAAAL